MLAGPDSLVVLHMPGERTQDESLHNLARHRGQADRPVVPGILLPALPVDGCYTGDPPVVWDHPCVIVWLRPVTKAPRGRPSPRWGAEENGKKQAKNWWVGIRAV